MLNKRLPPAYLALATAWMLASTASAAIPANIEARIMQIGPVIDAPDLVPLYGPLQPKPPFTSVGVKFTRDIHYGKSAREILDVGAPVKPDASPRPVFIFASGGAGDKKEGAKGGEAFYDNMAIWAVHNGFIGIDIERDAGPGTAWDQGGRNISSSIQWAQKNIAKFGGDPKRIYILGQSAGGAALITYLGHKEEWGPQGIGLKAAIIQTGPGNLLPLKAKTTGPALRIVKRGGTPTTYPPTAPVDPAVQLQRSSLPGMESLKIPVLITTAEYDPPAIRELLPQLVDAMKKSGASVEYRFNKGHDHMSQVFSVGSDDTSVSAPNLAFLRAHP